MSENHLPAMHNSDAVDHPLLRVQCSICCTEVGMCGKREDMQDLLQRAGWRLGANTLCPKCVREKAREFFRKYH